MPVLMLLLPDERRLVWALRDVPEGPLRAELLALFEEILADARSPRCAEAQADGVPCACLGQSCAECERVLSRFRSMRAPAAAGGGPPLAVSITEVPTASGAESLWTWASSCGASCLGHAGA